MKNDILSTDQAMNDIFTIDNRTIAHATGANYNTVASWKFNYYRNALSLEKQFEILTKMGFEPKNNIQWKKQAK
jgi:hypothetical protein